MIPRLSPNYGLKELTQSFTPASVHATKELEDLYKHYTNHEYCFLFKYGRSGLYYLLQALNAHHKKVIMASYTCVVVANAVVMSGAIPVFIDNDNSDTFQPNWEKLYSAIDDQTVMIIVTHLFGISQDTEALYKKVKKNYPNIFILQDCAHSFFCKDENGIPITQWGDGALFGMNISKLINSVKGGALTLKSGKISNAVNKKFKKNKLGIIDKFFERIYVIVATFAFLPFFYKLVLWVSRYTPLLNKELFYYNSKEITLPKDYANELGNFSASIGILSFKKYEERIRNRQKIAKYYLDKINASHTRPLVIVPDYNTHYTYSHLPIVINTVDKKELIAKIEKYCCVEIGEIIQYSIIDLPMYESKNFKKCPEASNLSCKIINLPLTYLEVIPCFSAWKTKCDKIIDLLEELIKFSK